jgi:hypothetical protein
MFDSRIIVSPRESGAVKRLEWDSDSQTLYVTYKSGDNVYLVGRVDYASWSELNDSAQALGSWGRALYRWKQGRVVSYEERDRAAFDQLIKDMHPETVDRMANWFLEEAASG